VLLSLPLKSYTTYVPILSTLLRKVKHTTNPTWSLVTRYYRSYLAPAKRRIGVQIRMLGYASIPADDMFNQILAC